MLNFVPPTTADGYLEIFQRNAQGLETEKVRLPVKFTTRSTDPQAYPTAYAKANTSMLEQPGGKEIRKDITKGRVVAIVKTKADWSQILINVYDTPMDFTGWVPNSMLTADSSNLDLIEGRLQSDVTLWYAPPPDGKPKDYKATGGQPVLIRKRRTAGRVVGYPVVMRAGFRSRIFNS